MTTLQLRRGTTAQVAAATPEVGELLIDTSTNKVYVGDGSTVGGKPIVASNLGVTDGSAGAAGTIGEYLSNDTTAAAITSAVTSNQGQITLTPGEWDVVGHLEITLGAGATGAIIRDSISTTSAAEGGFGQSTILNAAFTAGSLNRINSPVVRLRVTSNTVVYNVCYAAFTGGTATARGRIRATRIR